MKGKTRKSAAKRVKVKKHCILRKNAYKGHLLRKKNSKRLRKLGRPSVIHASDTKVFQKMLPYN
jgi:large subunit ribosomal protein L35